MLAKLFSLWQSPCEHLAACTCSLGLAWSSTFSPPCHDLVSPLGTVAGFCLHKHLPPGRTRTPPFHWGSWGSDCVHDCCCQRQMLQRASCSSACIAGTPLCKRNTLGEGEGTRWLCESSAWRLSPELVQNQRSCLRTLSAKLWWVVPSNSLKWR